MYAKSAIFGLILFCGGAAAAQAQLIDPNQHCVYQPGSTNCVPIPPRSPNVIGPYPPQGQGQPIAPPIDAGRYVVCATTAPVPGTKNMLVTNVFRSDDSLSAVEEQLIQYESSQQIDVQWKCIEGDKMSLSQQLQATITNFSVRGYNIMQVRHM